MITQTRTYTVQLGNTKVRLSEPQLRTLQMEIDTLLGSRSTAIEHVCRHFQIDQHRLFAPGRTDLACVRRWFVYKLLEREGMTHKWIAKEMGVHYDTVRHGLKSLQTRLESDPWTQETWKKLNVR